VRLHAPTAAIGSVPGIRGAGGTARRDRPLRPGLGTVPGRRRPPSRPPATPYEPERRRRGNRGPTARWPGGASCPGASRRKCPAPRPPAEPLGRRPKRCASPTRTRAVKRRRSRRDLSRTPGGRAGGKSGDIFPSSSQRTLDRIPGVRTAGPQGLVPRSPTRRVRRHRGGVRGERAGIGTCPGSGRPALDRHPRRQAGPGVRPPAAYPNGAPPAVGTGKPAPASSVRCSWTRSITRDRLHWLQRGTGRECTPIIPGQTGTSDAEALARDRPPRRGDTGNGRAGPY
jgi:hypothetical protein